MSEDPVSRRTLALGGRTLSYLHAGKGPPLLLIHGTYCSCGWALVMPRLAREHEVFALDYPGFRLSGGRLAVEGARVPGLAELVLQAAGALGLGSSFSPVGHDIGGAVAQHIAAFNRKCVRKLASVHGVLYDSWSMHRVAMFRDPDVAEASPRRISMRSAAKRSAGLSGEACRPLKRGTTSRRGDQRTPPVPGRRWPRPPTSGTRWNLSNR